MSAVAPSWRPRFSPQGHWPDAPVAGVRDALRAAFGRWGMPGLLRVDNGFPWGSRGDLPTDLALWLIGLGVDLWWNQPRRPQQNGVVERSQGTGKAWGEPHTAAGAAELQARLDELDGIQRREYPYREGKSRLGYWPGLAHSGRAYRAGAEARTWRPERVGEHLSGYCVPRRVDQKGQVSIYNRNHYVGAVNRQKAVLVTFAGGPPRWVVSTEEGVILKEIPADEVSAERIRALRVTHRRGADAGA
jgi:hypothetical protein